MKPVKLVARLMIPILTLQPLLAVASEPSSEPEAAVQWAEPAPQEQAEGGFLLHVQAALNFRVNGGVATDFGSTGFQLAWTVAGMKWDRQHSTWGLGGRFALDDHGARGGPLGLWRTPLNQGRGAYFQVSTGWYLFGQSIPLSSRAPGYFFEAEIAPSNNLALTLGRETLQFERYHGYYDYGQYVQEPTVRYSTSSYYLGVKLGQWAGLTGTALLFAAAAAAVSGMNN